MTSKPIPKNYYYYYYKHLKKHLMFIIKILNVFSSWKNSYLFLTRVISHTFLSVGFYKNKNIIFIFIILSE